VRISNLPQDHFLLNYGIMMKLAHDDDGGDDDDDDEI
jgi:hypothetical protein